MPKKVNTNWYTLTEVLVVIGIIWILAVWASQLNFSRLNDKQLVDIQIVKMENIISEIRDNALVWRAVWPGLDTPIHWNIEFSTAWSWSIRTRYLTGASTSYANYPGWAWNSPNNTLISDIQCEDFLGNTVSTGSVSLWFTGSKIGIVSLCENPSTHNYKVVRITYQKSGIRKSLSINTVTGAIGTD